MTVARTIRRATSPPSSSTARTARPASALRPRSPTPSAPSCSHSPAASSPEPRRPPALRDPMPRRPPPAHRPYRPRRRPVAAATMRRHPPRRRAAGSRRHGGGPDHRRPDHIRPHDGIADQHCDRLPGHRHGRQRAGDDRRHAAAHRLAVAVATEMLFAIGAGDQVVAVDDYSNYPAGPDHRPVGLRAQRRGHRRATSPTSSCSPATPTLVAARGPSASTVLLPRRRRLDDTYAQLASSARPPATPKRPPTGRRDAATNRRARRRGAGARGAADLLPRARRHATPSRRPRSSASSTRWPASSIADPADPTRRRLPAAVAEFLVDADPDVSSSPTRRRRSDRRRRSAPAPASPAAGRDDGARRGARRRHRLPLGAAIVDLLETIVDAQAAARSVSDSGAAARAVTARHRGQPARVLPGWVAAGASPSSPPCVAVTSARCGTAAPGRPGAARPAPRRGRRLRPRGPRPPSSGRSACPASCSACSSASSCRSAGGGYQGVVPQPARRPVPARRRRRRRLGATIAIVGTARLGRAGPRAARRLRRGARRRRAHLRSWARGGGRVRSTASLILAGVAVAGFLTASRPSCSSATTTPSARSTRWMLGSLTRRGATSACCCRTWS